VRQAAYLRGALDDLPKKYAATKKSEVVDAVLRLDCRARCACERLDFRGAAKTSSVLAHSMASRDLRA
jgi:hypothetical protein